MAQPIKCKAGVLYKEGEPVVLEDVIIPVPGDDQIRIKMKAIGICASDAHYVWGTQTLDQLGHQLPCILGHEGAGVVVDVGSKITDLKPGDHVLTTFAPLCKRCPYCSIPDNNVCLTYNFLTMGRNPICKLAKNNEPIYGFVDLGVFAEYATINRASAIKIDKEANLEQSSVLSCCVPTGFFSAVNLAKVRSGSTCAIWGIGAVGLNVVQGCKYQGASHIIAIDINPTKKDIALQFGATEFINPLELKEPLDEYLKKKHFLGIDYAFDCFGSQKIIDTALNCLSAIGTFVMVGLAPPTSMVTYPAVKLISGRKIIGGALGCMKCDDAATKLIELYRKKEIKVDELITHKFKLEQINEGFQSLKDGKCYRSIITLD